jgi:outer membrane receptor protein involved in Fe transport
MKKHVKGRRRSLIASFVASALASAAAGPGTVWAQESGATLQGKTDANAEVTAKNVDTGLTRHTKAGADGAYALVGLPAGTYKVDAGPGTEQTVTLSVATTEVLDLEKLQTVTVTGAAERLVEVKTSEIGTIVSQHEIETVPQLTRNFLEFADTVPGMAFTVDASGNTSLRGGAMNTSSVNVYVDGVGQKNYVKEGGVSGQFFSQGNPFPQLAIGEYKVITSNYKAEYDQISSAAVTAVTKSGTNKFEGEVFGTYTGQNFRAETPSELAKVPNVKTDSKDKEFGAAFGGPIIQDMMHFFVTYEGKRYTTPIAITASGGPPPAGIIAQLPANVIAQLGPQDKSFNEDLYFGKLDWEPTADDRFVLSAKVRQESQSGIDAGSTALSASFDTINNDTRIDLRWERSADRWFNELQLTWEDTRDSPTPNNFGNGSIYTWQPSGPGTGNDQTIVTTGPASPLAGQNKGQRGPAISDEVTFSHLQWWTGDHTVKTGIKYKWVKLTAQDALNVNPQFAYDVSATGTAAIPYKAFFTDPVPGQSPVATSNNRQLGLYLQDDWAVNNRLTLNIGARWDYEITPAYLNHVTPANVVAALNGPNPDPHAPPGQTYAQALALGGINVNDYISTGNNRSAYAGEFQPRVGFAYDLQADQRHVIFGGVGRSYDRDLFDYLQLEETKSALPEETIFFHTNDHPCNTANANCVAWDPKYLNGLQNLQALVTATNQHAEVDALNNNLKAPYSDQFSLGIRNRLADWNTSVALARINSYDGFAFTLGNRYPNGAFFMNGGQPWGDPIPGFGAFIIGNNAIKTRNTEVLLSADKPFTTQSHWGATIAYTYTSATQNRDINEHYSFDEATLAQYPFIASNAVAKHRLVTTGSIGIPWDVTIAGKLTLATPIPYDNFTCTVTHPPTFFPSGSGCQAFAATPPGLGYRSFDLEVTKSFNVRDVSAVSLRVDVLNMFNVKNYNDYILGGNNGVVSATSAAYNPIGNIVGVPRTLRMTLSAKF